MTRGHLVVALAVVLGACKSHKIDGGSPDGAPAAMLDGGADGAVPAASASSSTGPTAIPPDDEIPASSSSDELTARARHLLEAVGKDDPDLASDILFPREGWLATRDAADPGKEWEKRVAGPFRKALRAAGRHHAGLDSAQFVSFELGHAMFQATPKKHGWKKPLWTVHGSHLTYLADGHTRTLTVREMTAWRGAWYVTRLR